MNDLLPMVVYLLHFTHSLMASLRNRLPNPLSAFARRKSTTPAKHLATPQGLEPVPDKDSTPSLEEAGFRKAWTPATSGRAFKTRRLMRMTHPDLL